MDEKKFKHVQFSILLILVTITVQVVSQNTVITDSATYAAKPSAVLDVQSTHSGFLVPRMTTTQRNDISNPAEGLLVYDTGLSEFYVYKASAWVPIASAPLWLSNNDSIYVTGSGLRVGVGTASPMGRFIIQGDATAVDEPLFEVKNSDGYSIFAVYEDSVAINFIETTGGKGVKGGFAVGGLNPAKEEPTQYFSITPHNVRVRIDTSTIKGVKGGFAVGGLNPGKSDSVNYFQITPDSARIYLRDPSKGYKGGFAVGGLNPAKGTGDTYLSIERDSARIYVKEQAKGVKGGFAVGGLNPAKQANRNFISLDPDNYFIGDSTGVNATTATKNSILGQAAAYELVDGNYNIYLGYHSGFSNTSGEYNAFMGYKAGYLNTGSYNTFIGYGSGEQSLSGDYNLFLGHGTGTVNTGSYNVFIGKASGNSNLSAGFNTFIGTNSGTSNTYGANNVFVGYSSGNSNVSSSDNTYLGHYAGRTATGEDNTHIGKSAGYYADGSCCVFIGHEAGYNIDGDDRLIIANGQHDATQALVFGNFSTQKMRVNNYLGVGRYALSNQLEVAGTASKSTPGDWSANSDRRIKTKINDIDNAYEIVLKLRPVTYRYTKEWLAKHPAVDDKKYYNFIAQEFREVFPQSVKGSGEYLNTDPEEILQIDTYNAQIVTIKAVQELIRENKELKERNKALMDDIGALRSEVQQIRQMMEKTSYK